MTVDLVPTWQVGDVELTRYPFSVDRDDSVEIGEPALVVESSASMLADGDDERVVRHGNRSYVIPVYIEGADLGDLAASEALLRRELKRPGIQLAHNPGDDFSPTSVYEVRTAALTPSRSDKFESHLLRKFTLTLTCAPFARSASSTTISALEVGATATTVSVDTCDSATGWSATVNGVSAAVSTSWSPGAVSVVELIDPAPQYLSLTRTGSVDFSANRYLVVEVGFNSGYGPVPIAATAGGVELAKLAQRLISPGWYQCVYDTGGATLAAITFTGYFSMEYADLKIRQVSKTNRPPGQSPRQPSRLIDVGGTERTPGSLRISAPDGTSPLNLTLVATWPDSGSGFSPPLRRWRTEGNTETTDAAMFSGKREPLWPNYVMHDIPIESLPDGTYQLMGLLRASSGGDYRVESVIQSRHNGVTLGEATWGETVTIPAGWYLVPMGHYRVPIVAAKAGEFRVGIKTPDGAGVEYDEAWLFPMEEDCALTAAVIAEPHLWLDSPDLTSRVPQVFEGAAADKSDAHWPRNGVHTMGQHTFTPGRTAVFTATHGVDWPEVTLDYFKNWHSNAAEEG